MALHVQPVNLLVPITETHYPYVPVEEVDEERELYPAATSGRVRRWVRGQEPLPGTDLRV